MEVHPQAGATAKENEARVKCKGNKKSDNYNTTLCTGNEYISLDAAEKVGGGAHTPASIVH
jgi:hypothetical protein